MGLDGVTADTWRLPTQLWVYSYYGRTYKVHICPRCGAVYESRCRCSRLMAWLGRLFR